MRKVLSVAGAVMIASSIFVMPASAQTGGQGGQTPNTSPGLNPDNQSGNQQSQPGQGGAGQQGAGTQGGQQGGQMGGGQMGGGMMGGGMMQAGFSCGPAAGEYGDTNVDAADFPGGGNTVPGLFFQLNYSGLPAPTTVGIIRYGSEERGADFQAVSTFVAQNASGTFTGAVGSANPSIEAQGGGTNEMRVGGTGGLSNSRGNRDSDAIPQSGAQRRAGAYTSGQRGGGIEPGEYVFDVFTGEMRQTGDGPQFVADPKGYLGTFTCGASQIGE